MNYHPLFEFFSLPKSCNLSAEEKNYYGSLTPQWCLLGNINRIKFIVSLFLPQEGKLLPYENGVNVHLFKPKFYEHSDLSIVCYVASHEVLAHTLRALALVCCAMKHHIEVSFSDDEGSEKIAQLISKWLIHDHVIVCRIESFIHFMKILSLYKIKANINDIRDFAINYELSRLPHNESCIGVQSGSINVEVDFCLTYFPTTSPYIIAANIKYEGVHITLLQLTWGQSLSAQLIDSVFKHNPNIKKIGFIGGVGYIGKEDVNVDDVFIPEYLIETDDSYSVKKIRNDIFISGREMIFNEKKVVAGRLKTVTPKIGVLSSMSKLPEYIKSGIDAVDMEMEAFIKKLDCYPETKIGACYYIMDKPKQGQGLGSTYYNISFLRNLFSTYHRAKHACFERVLYFMVMNN